jgi:hypothetical protein
MVPINWRIANGTTRSRYDIMICSIIPPNFNCQARRLGQTILKFRAKPHSPRRHPPLQKVATQPHISNIRFKQTFESPLLFAEFFSAATKKPVRHPCNCGPSTHARSFVNDVGCLFQVLDCQIDRFARFLIMRTAR